MMIMPEPDEPVFDEMCVFLDGKRCADLPSVWTSL
jgi:hypothetical protein